MHPSVALRSGLLALPSQRIAGIDGLRAFAVIAVMLFHADYALIRGGYLGVDVFFVISGFLITRILLHELEREKGISLLRFFERRARRLLPAMLAVLCGTALACQWLRQEALQALAADTLASLLLMANWHFIANEVAYFAKFEGHQMLQHLWSLAVEEQFYLIWPLIVLAVVPRWGRFALASLAGALAIASALWMGWLARTLGFPESTNIDRVYLGTDTHAFGLLLGAVLACFELQLRELFLRLRKATRQTMAVLVATCCLVGLGALIALLGENHSLLYPLGFVLAAMLSAGLILALLMSSSLGALLDRGPLQWIGERSYGIYLWHWPVFALSRPGLDLDLTQDQCFVLRCLMTVSFAALSYHVIELPILGRSRPPATFRPRVAVLALSGALVSGASVFAIAPQAGTDAALRDAVPEASPGWLDVWRQKEMRSMLQAYDLGVWRGSPEGEKPSSMHAQASDLSFAAAETDRLSSDWSGFVAYAIANRLELGIRRSGDEPRALLAPPVADTALPVAEERRVVSEAPKATDAAWNGLAHHPLRPPAGNAPELAKHSADSPAKSAHPGADATPPFPTALQSVIAPVPLPGWIGSAGAARSSGAAGSSASSRPSGEGIGVGPISFFGDSVLLGARTLLERGIAGSVVHAEVGWQAADVLRSLQRVREFGELHPTVLIHLGTNGYVSEKQLRAMLELLDDRRQVLVVNSRVPKRWMAANNALMEQVVPEYRNAILIDWFALSDTRTEYFVADGVHLSPAGMRAFAALIRADHSLAQAR